MSMKTLFRSPNKRVYGMRYWQLRGRAEYVGYDLSRYLEDRGFYTLNLPSTAPLDWSAEKRLLFADFSYRHAAVEAGLGEIGANQLLITPQFGPRVWLMAVITSARLTPDEPLGRKLCTRGECNLCIQGCPQGALSLEKGINRARCVRQTGEYGLHHLLSHIKNILQEKDARAREELLFGPQTWGLWMRLQYGSPPAPCNACIGLCPIGRNEDSDLEGVNR